MPYYLYAGMARSRRAAIWSPTCAPCRRCGARTAPPRCAFRCRASPIAPGGCSSRRRVTPPPQAPTDPLARGRYLADHVAICTDCHTPRTRFGALDSDRYLAGTARRAGRRAGAEHHARPGDRHRQVVGERTSSQLLRTGMKPNMDNVQGLMAEVIDGIGGGPGYAQGSGSGVALDREILEERCRRSGTRSAASDRATRRGAGHCAGFRQRSQGGSDAKHGEVVGDRVHLCVGVIVRARSRPTTRRPRQAAARSDPRPPRADGGPGASRRRTSTTRSTSAPRASTSP